jgi:hypothetical protein
MVWPIECCLLTEDAEGSSEPGEVPSLEDVDEALHHHIGLTLTVLPAGAFHHLRSVCVCAMGIYLYLCEYIYIYIYSMSGDWWRSL